VVPDRARLKNTPSADLGVRQAVASEPRDPGLLGCELVPGLDAAFASPLAGKAAAPLRSSRSIASRYVTFDHIRAADRTALLLNTLLLRDDRA
jgi:hypothetical protein